MKFRSMLSIVILLLVMSTTAAVYAEQNQTTSITDLAGRTIEIPSDVHRVASLVGPGFEKIFLLGAMDKVAMLSSFAKQRPWAKKIIPGISDITAVDSANNPNIEELVNQKVDLVFFWDYEDPMEKMADVGIPVLVTQQGAANTGPQSIDEFKKYIKDEVNVFGDALGPEAKAKADEYNQYFDEKVGKIEKITAAIPESERPHVYYVRGPDALTTHGKNMYTQWWVTLAGGNLVSSDIEEGLAQVSIEQVISWNPDIIVMGRVNSTSLIMDDPKWKDIIAVKNGKVYTNPEGIMAWDYSSEGVLLLEYLAKIFYPDKFKDIDMLSEIKDYYSKFYNYSLTDDDANRILNHLNPNDPVKGSS
jgi:iron complex transport system substrate-binding protein